jgi:hypothetical protein
MPLVQPVPTPDYANILAQSLGAYRQVKDIQARGAQGARTAEIEDLSIRAKNDPQALQRLVALDPGRAAALQRMWAFEDRRFQEERAYTASEIEGLPVSEQVRILNSRIDMVRKRGGNPVHTEGLRDLLVSEDPNKIQQGQEVIYNARILGERQGFLKPRPQRKGTSLEQNAIAAGFTPGTPEYQAFIKQQMEKAGMRIQVGGALTEKEELAKLRVQELRDLHERARIEEDTLKSLDVMSSLDVRSGKAEPIKQQFIAWGSALGLDIGDLNRVARGESFTAEAGKLVLKGLSKQKGVQTERDTLLIKSTIEKLGNTPQANQFINDTARAVAKRVMKKRDFYDRYLEDNESLKGVNRAWRKYMKEVPFVARGLKNPDGLPMYYFMFEEGLRKHNPQITQKEVIQEWNRREKLARKRR